MNKPKMGRPKKERTGKQVWIPAESLDVVHAVVEAMKKPKQSQSQQAQQ
jgi:hypothetical protein